jgi:hypothetical protein
LLCPKSKVKNCLYMVNYIFIFIHFMRPKEEKRLIKGGLFFFF